MSDEWVPTREELLYGDETAKLRHQLHNDSAKVKNLQADLSLAKQELERMRDELTTLQYEIGVVDYPGKKQLVAERDSLVLTVEAQDANYHRLTAERNEAIAALREERDEAYRALAAAQAAIRELPVITDEMEAELAGLRAENARLTAERDYWKENEEHAVQAFKTAERDKDE